MYRTLRVLALCGSIAAAIASSAVAQAAPMRPMLPEGADPNHWESYFNYGVSVFRRRPSQAQAAFYWAERLSPERAEPLFGQWAAFWMRDYGRWETNLTQPELLRTRPDVLHADSLRLRAYLRNPFVHRALEAVLYEQLPGEWRRDLRTRAWLAYANADFAEAVTLFGRSIQRNPRKNWRERFERASAFTSAGRFDEAAGEMALLIAAMEEIEASEMLSVYESKAVLRYGLGLLHQARRDTAQAREAFAGALLEDLSFAPAHAALGSLASAGQDHAEAIRAYEQAVELSPDDAVIRYRFAFALALAGQVARAEEQARRAIALEPHYAEPYALWGSTLEDLGRAPEARKAYAEYLARAPRGAVQRPAVEARLAGLRAAGTI